MLGLEVEIQQELAHDNKNKRDHHGPDVESALADVLGDKRSNAGIEYRVLSEEGSDRLSVGTRLEYDEVHGEHRGVHDDTAEQRSNAKLHMHKSREDSGSHSSRERDHQAQPGVDALDYQHAA